MEGRRQEVAPGPPYKVTRGTTARLTHQPHTDINSRLLRLKPGVGEGVQESFGTLS